MDTSVIVSIIALVVSVAGVAISFFIFYLDSKAQSRRVLNQVDKLWKLVIEFPGDINATNDIKGSLLETPLKLKNNNFYTAEYKGLKRKTIQEYNKTVEFWIDALKNKSTDFKHLTVKGFYRWKLYISFIYKRLKTLKKDLKKVNDKREVGSNEVGPDFKQQGEPRIRLDYELTFSYSLTKEIEEEIVAIINSLNNRHLFKGIIYLKKYLKFKINVWIFVSQFNKRVLIKDTFYVKKYLQEQLKLKDVSGNDKPNDVKQSEIIPLYYVGERETFWESFDWYPKYLSVKCAKHGTDTLIVNEHVPWARPHDQNTYLICANDKHFYTDSEGKKVSIPLFINEKKFFKNNSGKIKQTDVLIYDKRFEGDEAKNYHISKPTLKIIKKYLNNISYSTDRNVLLGYCDYIEETINS